jgi:hypothetical protein
MAAKRESSLNKVYSNQTGGGTGFMQFGFSDLQVHGIQQNNDSNSETPRAYFFSNTYVVRNIILFKIFF